ncbi:MAG: hypothetical protein WC919_07770 [Candidatus Paceibacterota bacterium]|jgi:hypothetical protein
MLFIGGSANGREISVPPGMFEWNIPVKKESRVELADLYKNVDFPVFEIHRYVKDYFGIRDFGFYFYRYEALTGKECYGKIFEHLLGVHCESFNH